MLLADGAIVVWFGGLILVGFLAFFLFFIAAVATVFRRVFGLFMGCAMPRRRGDDRLSSSLRACSNADCGFLNPPGAKYCARCGRRVAQSALGH